MAKHRTQTQPCCYGSLIKCDKYWTAGDYCVLLLRMKPYDFFSAFSPPQTPDKTICHFIQQNTIVWAMVASDWTINTHAECKEIELQPWFKWTIIIWPIVTSARTESLRALKWNPILSGTRGLEWAEEGRTNPTAEEPLALDDSWEGDSQCSSWIW